MIRFEFVDSAVSGENIHPDFIFQNERDLAYRFVSDLNMPDDIYPCPVCGGPRKEILFQKWGFQYALCSKSWTVGLAAFPTDDILEDYFRRSDLAQFRASKGYQKEVSKQRKDLWRGQINWIEGRIGRYLGSGKYKVIDWGSKSAGWVEMHSKAGYVDTFSTKEPLPPIRKGEEPEGAADIVCLMDVFQRERDPAQLLARVNKQLRNGGLVIATCRAGSGFDVLTLRERSNSIFPLDHIVLPSPEGLKRLFEQAGLSVLELTTPGLLDMTYIKQAQADIPRDQFFLRYVMDQQDELLLERMQSFLQRNNLSSHLRCVAKK